MRRITQITEAHRQDPNRPAWHAVKHFTGDSDALDLVPSSLRTFNARKLKEEVDIENLRARQKGLAPTPDAADAAEVGGLPSPGNNTAPKAMPRVRPKKGGGGRLGAPSA